MSFQKYNKTRNQIEPVMYCRIIWQIFSAPSRLSPVAVSIVPKKDLKYKYNRLWTVE